MKGKYFQILITGIYVPRTTDKDKVVNAIEKALYSTIGEDWVGSYNFDYNFATEESNGKNTSGSE